jgi:hypothetical protein
MITEVEQMHLLPRKYLASVVAIQEAKSIGQSISRFFTLSKMTLDFKKLNKLVIVTGASSTHQRSLLQLIKSISTFESEVEVHVFDLGMESNFLDLVENECREKNYFLHKYDFSKKPGWMDIKNPQKGEWAWKADCVKLVADDIASRNKNLKKVNLLWLDAGNKLIASINLICRYIQNYHFWSPASEGSIEKWTVPAQIELIIGSNKFDKKTNLNGAMIGFNLASPVAVELLTTWKELSAEQKVIAPPGSSRKNHRQDQSLLTLLAYKSGLATKSSALNLHKGCLLQHQDIDFEG